MKERLVIVFIATILGLLLTTAGYFIYQAAIAFQEAQPEDSPITIGDNRQQKQQNTEELSISEPLHEAVVDRRTIDVKGRTFAENTIVVSTNNEDVVGTPNSDGNFSVSVTIDAGVNKIITRSISPEGEEIEDERLVTYSAEEF